jgi:hypothetical protein
MLVALRFGWLLCEAARGAMASPTRHMPYRKRRALSRRRLGAPQPLPCVGVKTRPCSFESEHLYYVS